MGLTTIVSLCRCVWAETAIASLYWCVQKERSYRCAGMCIGIDRIDIGVYSNTTRFPAYRIACCSTHLLPTTHKMKTSKNTCICKSLSKQQKKQIAFIIAVIFSVQGQHQRRLKFFNLRIAMWQEVDSHYVCLCCKCRFESSGDLQRHLNTERHSLNKEWFLNKLRGIQTGWTTEIQTERSTVLEQPLAFVQPPIGEHKR